MNPPLAPAQLLALLELLSDGRPRAPSALALESRLEEVVLRAALPMLSDHGVRQMRQGAWRIPGGLELMRADLISGHLAPVGLADLPLRVAGVTGSTNDDARELVAAPAAGPPRPEVLFAEAQVQGRGRRGRHWSSPVASNLYLTQIEPLPGGIESAAGLSLAVGVAVAEAVERIHGVEIQLKWPNDLLVQGRKLGGILVELAPGEGAMHALVGIGVNVRVPDYVGRDIDQPWTDLATLTGGPVSRNATAAAVVASVRETLDQFRDVGFDARMRALWQARDPFFGRRVSVTTTGHGFHGLARGIDESGELLVDTDAGRQRLGAGEVSIRLLEEAG